MPETPPQPAAAQYQVYARILRMTAKAVLVGYAGQEIWLPKSHVRVGVAPKGEITPIWLPLWLARKKGFVSAPRPRRRA